MNPWPSKSPYRELPSSYITISVNACATQLLAKHLLWKKTANISDINVSNYWLHFKNKRSHSMSFLSLVMTVVISLYETIIYTYSQQEKSETPMWIHKFILKFDCRISGLYESWLSSPNLKYFQFFMDSDSDIHLASVKTLTYLELPPYSRMHCHAW